MLKIDKSKLLQKIIVQLQQVQKTAAQAAEQAHSTATHGESVAKSKYETFGLEASYLAQGQSQRVTECEQDLQAVSKLVIKDFSDEQPIALGALVKIETLDTPETTSQWLFVSPGAGGGGILVDYWVNDLLQQTSLTITLVTPQAPLGKSLLGLYCDDEFSINLAGQQKSYQITAVI
ncbi:transcription elongation factor [Pelagibaculum spongiae]|uniref:Transcription elongation factor n=1 Tax=Pelagibaculum spongiae TaxID=2080658 RepID=A0A2V1GZE3_9GAMM|nr:transcription elongation factor [Pelagibaculum spongiae]PVZ70324.1 transcription elongation factor [Pelagibaculum spongiae]